jgi:Family of unknown function (DUF6069)
MTGLGPRAVQAQDGQPFPNSGGTNEYYVHGPAARSRHSRAAPFAAQRIGCWSGHRDSRERRALGCGTFRGRIFRVASPLVTQVGIVLVVVTTLLAFAVGSGLLALAVRRSRGWVRAVLIAAALVAVVSAGAPLSVAQDTATGVLLATMHLVAGAAFLITAWRVVPPAS